MLDKKAQSTNVRDSATLDVTHSSLETGIFNPREMLGILDLKSIGYYRIKHDVLQKAFSTYCTFDSVYIPCDQFNKFVNILKKEKKESDGKYPWLVKEDEGRNMPDRDIWHIFR